MSEVRMWEYMRDKVRGHVGIERITEKLNDGVPDTVYQFPAEVDTLRAPSPGPSGWLELKYLGRTTREWPLVRIPWKSAAQPFWLNRWARWGGRAGILLRIESLGWFYWRASTDIRWIGLIQAPVNVATTTWQCGPELDVDGLLKALH